MKTLLLVRHAKSSWDDSDLSDFDRPLSPRGEKDAPRMGEMLKKRGIIPGLMYSSPAVRALTTAEIIARTLGYAVKDIVTDPQLYHAGEEKFLKVLHHASDKYDSIMLFGHNPGLTQLAIDLFRERISNVPTAGVVCGSLNIHSWKDVRRGCGALEFFEFPKNL